MYFFDIKVARVLSHYYVSLYLDHFQQIKKLAKKREDILLLRYGSGSSRKRNKGLLADLIYKDFFEYFREDFLLSRVYLKTDFHILQKIRQNICFLGVWEKKTLQLTLQIKKTALLWQSTCIIIYQHIIRKSIVIYKLRSI